MEARGQGGDRPRVLIRAEFAGVGAAQKLAVRLPLRRDADRASLGNDCLTGRVLDQAQLHGHIERIEELGLELVSVEQTEPTP